MNTLILLPARARQVVYVIYGLVALAVAAARVAYDSLNLNSPPWLTVANAVVAFLAVPVGAIAALNVSRSPDEGGQQVAANWEAAHARNEARVAQRRAALDQLAAAVDPNAPEEFVQTRDADGDGRDDTTGRYVARPPSPDAQTEETAP